jgi:uracil-DNA glycosylase family 4
VASRLRAVPGGGHPHCSVMVVALHADPQDEEDGGLSGETLLADLAAFMPALAHSRDQVYVTALVKCVPRGDGAVRGPLPQELDHCFAHLSKELTITTPHYVLTVGEETTRYLLGKLFKNRPYEPGDSLELRVFDNPAVKVVPVATPDELRERDPKTRQEYSRRLRTLAQVMGL